MPTFQATIYEGPESELFHALGVHVVRTHVASLPIEADLIVTPSGVFTTVSVSVIDETTIRVTFPEPAKNNAALIQPGNYVISPTLTVYSVTPEAVALPNYVDLVIDEQTTGVVYEVEVQGIEKA